MPLGTALAESARLSWDTTTETGVVIGRSLGGRAPPGGVIGVVGMAWLSGRVAERLGWRGLIDLAAMFSLGVGLLNLVPVVPLDGGHLALLAVERLRRRDVSARVRLGLALAGLALMIVLLVTTVVLDLRWMSRAA